MLSWVIDRDVFNERATELRERFDKNRNVTKAAAARLIEVRSLGG